MIVAAEKRALRGVAQRAERELAMRCPRVLRQERDGMLKIRERRPEGGRGARSLRSPNVQLGELYPFVLGGDELSGAIEMVHHLEDARVSLRIAERLPKSPAYPEMKSLSLVVVEKGVRRLLHPVVREPVGRGSGF